MVCLWVISNEQIYINYLLCVLILLINNALSSVLLNFEYVSSIDNAATINDEFDCVQWFSVFFQYFTIEEKKNIIQMIKRS